MEKNNRRKIFIINSKLQYRFLGFSLLLSFVSASLFYLATLYLFWKFEQTGYEVGLPAGHIFFRFIGNQRNFMSVLLLVASPIIIFVTCYVGIKFSHRVAGPIYQMTKHLKELNNSAELTEVTFRENDYFIELQDEFNIFIKSVKKS
jgi:sensor histidine kinase YesM